MPPCTLETLQATTSTIFNQAQVSIANHRKNCVALYKIHLQSGSITELSKNASTIALVGEHAFGDAFIDMINRVLPIKNTNTKSCPADRVVKFVGSYFQFLNEKVSEQTKKQHLIISSGEDILISRFIVRLLQWLLQGFLAKNTSIRFRSVQFVSELISHLGEINEDIYGILRDSLMDRVYDKETYIRVQATIAISKLVGSEDSSTALEAAQPILEILVDLLCYDQSADVRRTALLCTPLIPATLVAVLTRTRDTDPIVRQRVYLSVQQIDPRQLTMDQRNKIVKNGLEDREPAVRSAAAKMVVAWLDQVCKTSTRKLAEVENWTDDGNGVMRSLVDFIRIFDVLEPKDNVALDALTSVFMMRPNVLDLFTFPVSYWTDISIERAVLARSFVHHCIDAHLDDQLDSASLPTVTSFACYLQEHFNLFSEMVNEDEEARLLGHKKDGRESEMFKAEMILGELLRIVMKLDYSDELGRRKVYLVVRDMLSHPQLPERLIEHCLDVLEEICPTERELVRVVVEVITDLRDDDTLSRNDDVESAPTEETQSESSQGTCRKRSRSRSKARHEMTASERLIADVTDMRCLIICMDALKRVNGSFEDNSTLEGVVADLIIPAVKRDELEMREKGLVCLGLCCLIAKNMALNSFQLFISQVQNSPEDLKLHILQVIFDLLLMYDREFFGRSENNVAEKAVTFLLQVFESEESDIVKAVLSTGISKLLLAGLVTDSKVLMSLVLTYVSPTTANNLDLRQCLSYFFPVYCYSSSTNQGLMQSIFIAAYDRVCRIYVESEAVAEGYIISPYQFGLLLVDWTNPEKLVDMNGMVPYDAIDRDAHYDLATDILGALYDSERNEDDRESLCRLLLHLTITPRLEARSVLLLDILISHLKERCPFDNSGTEKIFGRFQAQFSKVFRSKIAHIDPQQYVDDEEFSKLYEFIGVAAPSGSDRVAHPPLQAPLHPKHYFYPSPDTTIDLSQEQDYDEFNTRYPTQRDK